ncbi:hypothetical protein [Aureimonas leprariae]|uniref:Uncharacterized protein n=1 Tax=Plantimonas leprariae TaxID=2615207 RepID=A0A7V7U039_9HYPH|nr:hypothetical protein [Aureimonas leprariae]KAB0680016.1 hypothetical protein F6X38_10630 [Aureimonas leprariae]
MARQRPIVRAGIFCRDPRRSAVRAEVSAQSAGFKGARENHLAVKKDDRSRMRAAESSLDTQDDPAARGCGVWSAR